MDATLAGGTVRAGRQARERFYDSRGYGEPRDGDLVLAPVEAAHLLFRGDLESVDGMGFREFLASAAVTAVEFQVYRDLRDRGFYLSPVRARDGDGDGGAARSDPHDFVVYPRGKGPWDDAVAYRVRAVSERADVSAAGLAALADGEGVLAVVDEESELTYLSCARDRPTGATDHDLPAPVPATLLSDRVLVPDAPPALHDRAFYGQRLDGDGGDLQLSLVEAAFLAGRGVIDVRVDGAGTDGDGEAVLRERGRSVEGDRFDRRLQVYEALRGAGLVPKTGFKFGADFRTYAHVEDVERLGHSELLVRVLPRGHVFSPRALALDVRLAGGVRKRMVFALADADGPVDWLSVERLTP
jgi:tRNA-intron endonuclease